jgi:large exoprotein involved in heme utilization and adhesion
VATGNGGNLTIVTDTLIVEDGATVAVDSFGTGNAGTLEAIANSIQVEEGARLTASTVSGAWGNIRLDTSTLELRRGAQINTDAGNTDGGNIQIAADTIVAFENSDITANALEGRGGQVTIAAQAIFGTQFRDRATPESDITATSQLGAQFSGTVSIETPDVDPTSGLVDLPESTANAANQVTQGCAAASGNTFMVTGRGGLPPNPTQPFAGRSIWRDVRSLASEDDEVAIPQPNDASVSEPPLREAHNWEIDEEGRVRLVANSSSPWAIDLGAIQCDR